MKSILVILMGVGFSSVSLAGELDSRIAACRDHFAGRVESRAKLVFICLDPSTSGTRSDFIALQYTAKEVQTVLICYESASGSAVLEQNNYLVAATGLLNLVGQAPVEDWAIAKMSYAVQSSLAGAKCTDGRGIPLTD